MATKGKALFGIITDMVVRQSRKGSEYVRATLVSKRRDGSVAFQTQIVAFTPQKESAKNPVELLKALGNDADVRVYGFMEDVDNGKFKQQMMRVIDASENTRNAEAKDDKASAETAAETTKEDDVEVPF